MNLFKSFFTVSFFTLLSRIMGLVREVLIARAFGAGAATDAFNIAFRLPNLFRRLFAEGAFSQAFVPILAEYKNQQSEVDTKKLIDNVSIALTWILIIFVIIGILIAPILVYFVASGFNSKQHEYSMTIDLTRIMFSYIGFMSLVALSSGILNTWQKFAIPAVTPVLLNLSFIICALVFSGNIYALAWSVVIGGFLQLAFQIPSLYKIGMLPNFKIIFLSFSYFKQAIKSAEVRRVAKQMLPATFAVSVAQISLIINTNIASHLPTGSVSWLSYADRLMEFPSAILGVALSTVLMSNLSKHSANKDSSAYSSTLDWGLKFMLILTVPCALGLFMYGNALCATLFHYGKFTAYDVEKTNSALMFYGIGIIGLIAVKILAPGFYAKQNIKTPVKISFIVLICTQIINFITVPYLQHAGLALSIGLGACINATLLLIGLIKLKMYRSHFSIKYWLVFILKISTASAILAMLMYYFNMHIDWIKLSNNPILRLGYLFGSIIIFFITYFSALYVMRINIIRFIKNH